MKTQIVPVLCFHIWSVDGSFVPKHVPVCLVLVTIRIVALLTEINYYTGRFVMYSGITRIYYRKTVGLKSFKYLGSTVNTDDSIEEEIKERISQGNKAFFANKKIFQSKLRSKTAKLKLYFSVIRPVVTYACETWIIKERITNRLMVFERRILRKIFVPTYENGSWRIKTNQEMAKLIKHKSIINFARVQRLGRYGHIERMLETRMVKAIYSWKPILKGPTGRPKIRWEDC